MSNPSYAGLTSSDSSIRATALGQLGTDWTSVMNDGSSYTASLDGGNHLVFTSQAGHALSISGTDTLWQEAASPFTSSAQQAVTTPQTTTPTTVSIAGVATSDLQSYLQGKLGTDYNITYSQATGALFITLNSGNTDGVTSFTTTGSSVNQSVGGTPAVNTPKTVDLTGVTIANLQSSILTQLNSSGSNYTVTYDQNSGALNISISAAGTSAGITSIASSGNNAVETAPAGTAGLSAFNVFTSDGTASGGYSLDVTVGSLTTANLGKSNGTSGTNLSSANLNSQASAAAALNLITAAVDGISSQRGTVGANINRLIATASDIGTEQINLTSASNSILNADIGKSGMASLQQANQAQQAVLKLLQ
jgi:flagellin-like hook-associated protein FlgL